MASNKEFMNDLKPVYQAVSKEVAEDALLKVDEKWGKLYPIVLQSWNNKWENLSVYFKYTLEIRKVIYTTNIIKSVYRQFRKLTKTKGAFPNENSLLKLLYMGIQNATKKWNMPMLNWNLTLSQLAIFFYIKLTFLIIFILFKIMSKNNIKYLIFNKIFTSLNINIINFSILIFRI